MRRTILFFLLGLLYCNVYGQTANQYVFSTGTGATMLAPVFTQIVAVSQDDAASTVQNIGFTFTYEGTAYTQFSVNSNGLLRLGSTAVSTAYTNDIATAGNDPKIFPLWDDLSTASNGGVYTGLYGSSGSYVRVIEWRVFNTSSTGSAYNCTFQVRLYQTGNIVEFAYGSGTTTSSASVGIGGALSTNYQSVTVASFTSSNTTPNNSNTAWPGSGRYFRFSPPVSLPGDNCSNAIDLSTLSSPYNGSTVGYTDDISTCRTGSPDQIFYINVPNGATLDIWESANAYDEWEYVGYGASCPGVNTINCWDNDALAHTVWTNSTGSAQTVWYIQDGYSSTPGTFTLNWSVTNPCTPPAAPSPATASPATVICGQSVNLNAVSAGNTIRWYDAASGGSLLGSSASGANYTVSPASTQTYYAEAYSSCASASRTAVTVTVNPPAAPTSVSATPASVMCGQNVNLNATSAGNTIRWYTTASGGTSLGSSASGANFAVNPATSATYYAETFASCASTTRTAVAVTVSPPPAPLSATASPSTITICGQACTLIAYSPGFNINWYDAPSGGNYLGTSASGAAFAVIPTATTTYYAESFLGCSGTSRVGVTVNYSPAKGEANYSQNLNATPTFVRNMGQIVDASGNLRPDVLFKTTTNGATLFFRDNNLVYVFHKFDTIPTQESKRERMNGNYTRAGVLEHQPRIFRMDMEFVGMNPAAAISADEKLEQVSNYYLPQCPQGITDVPHYSRIAYKGLYKKIDADYYFTDNGLKYDLILSPGAKLSDIRFKYNGANSVSVNEEGQLVIDFADGQKLIEETPYAYYTGEGEKRTANISFTVSEDDGSVGFTGEADDITETLIIDPSVTWATYFYNTESANESWTNPEYDANGNLFLANQSYQDAFPTINPGGGAWYDASSAYMIKIVVLKFDRCRNLRWSTYYGGDKMDNLAGCTDYGKALALDNSGNVFVAGYTEAGTTVFPTLNPGSGAFYQDQSRCYGETSFVLKFDNNGVRRWASMFTHETASTSGTMMRINGITCDGTWLYITGQQYNWTPANTIPLRNPGGGAHYQTTILGDQDVFVGRFSASTSVLNWCTYVHSTSSTNTAYAQGLDLHCDASGNLFLTGRESGTNSHLYLVNPGGGAYYQAVKGANGDLFITKFNTSLAVTWSTYYGGDGMDIPSTVEPDGSGNIYIIGRYTASTNFPVQNPGGGALYKASRSNAASDGFLLKFNSSGVRSWATYLGADVPTAGSDENHFSGFAYNSDANHIFVSGYTKSTLMSTVSQPGSYNQASNGGGSDMFFYEFDNNGVVVWSSYFGKANADVAYNGRLGSAVISTCSRVFSVFSSYSTNLNTVNPGKSWYQGSTAFAYNDFMLELSKPIITLPVELTSIDAHCNKGFVSISWSTLSETNNDFFTLEKSNDLLNWKEIAQVPGAGNSNQPISYVINDEQADQGVAYYRLSQTDFDGLVKTYDPVVADCYAASADLAIKVYPNPFSGELIVDLGEAGTVGGQISIYTMMGNLVKSFTLNSASAGKLSLNLSDLNAGVYTLMINTGTSIKSVRVVKSE
jgi:hypothetical protein